MIVNLADVWPVLDDAEAVASLSKRTESNSSLSSMASSLADLDFTSSVMDFWDDRHDGIRDVDDAILRAFLDQIDLVKIRPVLKSLGATKVKDLFYLTEEDLDDAHLDSAEARRLFEAIDAHLRRPKRADGGNPPECVLS
mmetsp:Transcript_10712/g.27274  ORF Transcript_10712/g.27274 Transcript_10712/m.27274 type:complete len:140 (+) Transcript_10712:35-454(+)|eukprot:CAMPEP_0197422738 /NCGR_PEP_ID=MMETSP1170-20131217/17359_1 /TAXON_ID=54406 /ORGANISM="Sarcinochrysis sp, Strain CCMP770" /LENGTH=139 /DNA_ID=CAMNT_0042950095 /DNA_START=35 /DNA_END=454 /DNA_ORIENTATION=-